MSDIFLSYKSENEDRVLALVRALEAERLSVWWDRTHLAAGESWRLQIDAALAAARTVVVVWTRESVGPEGHFVRDEAADGQRRGVLIPVLFDKVLPPKGFGELQFVDLRHWRGDRGDAFFQDLCAAVRARIDHRPAPRPRGPMRRLLRRATLAGLGSLALTFGGGAFALFSAQDQVCAAPWMQPWLSDLCGAAALGRRPTRAEREAWEGLPHGDCDALRRHVTRFPDGQHRRDAESRLAALQSSTVEHWVPAVQALELFVRLPARGAPDEVSARALSESAAQAEAERLCAGFGDGVLYRPVSARAELRVMDCGRIASAWRCSAEGVARCTMERNEGKKVERCAP